MEQRQEQELIKQKFTVESYNDILQSVVTEHLKNINKELFELYKDIEQRIDLSDTALRELNILALTETGELTEKIKNALWS